MTKPALAAVVALALSIPLANLAAGAQTSSAETKNESKSSVQTTFSAPQQASRAKTAGATPPGWVTTHGTSGTRPTQTATTATTTSTTSSSTTTGAATTSTATSAATTKTTTDDSVLVTSSTPRVASPSANNNPVWQKFYDYIKLKSGQDGLPLVLTVTNGNANHPPFQAVKLFLAGQQLATEKDFKNNVLQLKMDGTLNANSDNQLIIQAYGIPSAAISWKLSTQRAVITAVTPDSVGPGDAIKITGRNFSNKTGVTQVWIGEKLAAITSGNATKLNVTVPATAVGGESKVNVAVGGIAAKPFKITIKGTAPELSGTDIYGAPPGYAITVTGKGFAPNAADNVVTVGGMTAPISACSQTSITFSMPDLPNNWSPVPLIVKSKGVASKNTLQVQPSNRLLPTSQ